MIFAIRSHDIAHINTDHISKFRGKFLALWSLAFFHNLPWRDDGIPILDRNSGAHSLYFGTREKILLVSRLSRELVLKLPPCGYACSIGTQKYLYSMGSKFHSQFLLQKMTYPKKLSIFQEYRSSGKNPHSWKYFQFP